MERRKFAKISDLFMMNFQLLNKLEALPAEQRKEVSDIVDFLYSKYVEGKKVKEEHHGIKGFIKVNSDFYEPLEDEN